ncbi:hypothetical protein ILUMI_26073 [Ignelater luminosus]|uniref:Uncharacterized protein n=1 Tax=Ignelater luminosus TaxID=2038154 RepID=A0A8K0C765_IGNLU|nr:hypothetical protein ILUMI_26073 [Ignelater luminosus]
MEPCNCLDFLTIKAMKSGLKLTDHLNQPYGFPIEKMDNTNDLKLKIESYAEWFKLDSQRSLKELKVSEISSLDFGVQGSFRKLNIN